jgi:hypothetical protein
MDWLQFISSIINSLAWPAAVVVFLLIIRKRLGGLVERLIELHLPGGAKAIFKEALAEGRVIIERSGGVTASTPIQDKLYSPGSAPSRDYRVRILDIFQDVIEQMILLARERGFEEKKGSINDMIENFLRSNQIDRALVDLYERLRKARNAILHVGAMDLSDREIGEFIEQAKVLEKKLGELRKRS